MNSYFTPPGGAACILLRIRLVYTTERHQTDMKLQNLNHLQLLGFNKFLLSKFLLLFKT